MSVQSQRISGPSGELLEQLLLDDGRSSAESTFPVCKKVKPVATCAPSDNEDASERCIHELVHRLSESPSPSDDTLHTEYQCLSEAGWLMLVQLYGWKINAVEGEPRCFESFRKMVCALPPPPAIDKRKYRRPGFLAANPRPTLPLDSSARRVLFRQPA